MTPALIAIALFGGSFALIGGIVGTNILFNARKRDKSVHGVLIHSSPFPAKVIDEEIDRVLGVLHDIDPRLMDALDRILSSVEITYGPGDYILDSWGNKTNGHVIGARIFVADKGGVSIRRTALAHELAHVALHAADGDPDGAHGHAVFRVL